MPRVTEIAAEPSGTAASELIGHVGGQFRRFPVAIIKAAAGLDLVNNTADANKPISAAVQQALDGKAPSHGHPYEAAGAVALHAAAVDPHPGYLTAAEGAQTFSPIDHPHAGLLPPGGLTGYIPKKNSAADYDFSWQPDTGGLGGGGDALVASPLSQFAATTSAQLAGIISDETGAGPLVFANSPTMVNPVVGTQLVNDNSAKAASTAYADRAAADAAAAVVASSPVALNTLNELAAALGNDANFATTVTNAIGGKQASSTVLTFLAGAATADATGVRTRLSLSTVAATGSYADLTGRPTLGTASPLNVAASGDAAAGEVVKGNDTRLTNSRTPTAHTHPLPELTAAVVAGTSTERDAFNAAFAVADTPITASRPLLPATDDNRSSVVSDAVTVTLNTASLTDGAGREFVAAVGAVYSLLVGAGAVFKYGAITIAPGGTLSSALFPNGVMVIRRVGAEYHLESQPDGVIGAEITASSAFPARTLEKVQKFGVNSANPVVLTMSAGQFPAGDQRAVLIQKKGAGTLNFTGLTLQGATLPMTGKGTMILRADMYVADSPWVSFEAGAN